MSGKKVVSYSTPPCPICKRAKVYLTESGVSYQDIDEALELYRRGNGTEMWYKFWGQLKGIKQVRARN